MNENPYMKLVKFILPSEMTEYLDLVDVALDQYDDEQRHFSKRALQIISN